MTMYPPDAPPPGAPQLPPPAWPPPQPQSPPPASPPASLAPPGWPPSQPQPPEYVPFRTLPPAQQTPFPGQGPGQYTPYGAPPPRSGGRRTLGVVGIVLVGILAVGAAGSVIRSVWSAAERSIFDDASEGTQPSDRSGVALDGDFDVTAATEAQKIGVVTILTDLYYDGQSQAAGTGSVLTSDGMVLTNNHVIEGSTFIEVTVESTGDTYDAVVLGTDKTKDVALLQLDGAAGLETVEIGDGQVEVGDLVASIGNAQGTGNLVTAQGLVLATDEDLTISDGYGGTYESLYDLIEIDADVVSGDSGGPLVDDRGRVVGMVTAASMGRGDIRGYAIPIANALEVVEQIESGVETGTVNIGPTAFIGVTLAKNQGDEGITLDAAIAGTPAAKAGLGAGDTITAVDGARVFTITELKAIVKQHNPGDVIVLDYTDSHGMSQTVGLTLTEGPA